MTSTRADRAAARRAHPLPGGVVRLGEPKGTLHPGLSYEARLASYWLLIQRAWLASGRTLPPSTARADLPGEVFKISIDG